MKTIGDEIKRLRAEQRLSVCDLSILSGVKEGTIYKWESGERQDVTAVLLHKIAKSFGVSIDSIMEATT